MSPAPQRHGCGAAEAKPKLSRDSGSALARIARRRGGRRERIARVSTPVGCCQCSPSGEAARSADLAAKRRCWRPLEPARGTAAGSWLRVDMAARPRAERAAPSTPSLGGGLAVQPRRLARGPPGETACSAWPRVPMAARRPAARTAAARAAHRTRACAAAAPRSAIWGTPAHAARCRPALFGRGRRRAVSQWPAAGRGCRQRSMLSSATRA